MPGNAVYNRVIEFLMPQWDSAEVDVEFRNMGILGMQRTGKTTMAITISNDLKERYDDLVTIYGYWLHQVIPRAREDGVLKDSGHILVILDDATAFHAIDKQMFEKLQKELKYYWRIAHELKQAGVKQYTTKVVMLYLYHSYMLVNKFMRNAHLIAVKSFMPRFQQWEREDITLRWMDAMLVKELTRMRFSNDVREVEAALSKAIVVWMTGGTEIVKYQAIKKPPKDFHDYTWIEAEEAKDEELKNIAKLQRENKALARALHKLLDELELRTKRDKSKYLRVRTNGKWISLGPVAHIMSSRYTRR